MLVLRVSSETGFCASAVCRDRPCKVCAPKHAMKLKANATRKCLVESLGSNGFCVLSLRFNLPETLCKKNPMAILNCIADVGTNAATEWCLCVYMLLCTYAYMSTGVLAS